jgi:hypothetical protein
MDLRERESGSNRGWIKWHNELHNFYCSPHIVRLIISKKMRRTGPIGRMGKMKSVYKMLVRKPEEERQLANL